MKEQSGDDNMQLYSDLGHLYDVEDEKIVYITKSKGRSISYDEAVDHWHELGLCRELTPEEFDKYYE